MSNFDGLHAGAARRFAAALFCLAFSLLLVVGLASPAFADTRLQRAQGNSSQETQMGEIAKDLSDGVYYGSGEGYQSTITVAVTVASGKITDVTIVSHADDAAYVTRAEKLIANIIQYQSADVDVVSGVTFSSRGILSAVKDACSGNGSVAITNSIWFSGGMIALAVILFGLAIWMACKWMAASSRAEKAKLTRRQRWCVQGAFFLLAPSSFATAFMGLKTLLMQVNVMNTHRGYDFEVMTFTIFLVIMLVIAVVLGRFFCGYVCSFGLLGDAVYAAGNAICKKLGIKRGPLPAKLEFALRFVKYAVLIGICVAVLLGAYTAINSNSPWTVFGKLSNLSVSNVTAVGVGLLVLCVLGMLVKERFFCEFLCPLGAIYSILPTLPTGRMRRERPKCRKNCQACQKQCPVGVEPKGGLLAGECIMCGQCAEVCPQKNVTCGLELRADALVAAAAAAEAKAASAKTAEGECAAKDAAAATTAIPTGVSAAVGQTAAAGAVAEASEAAEVAPAKSNAAQSNASASDAPFSLSPAPVPKPGVRAIIFARPVSVIWKAALVLLVLWLMQVTRFLPML